jgi:hypothetical protein
MLRRAAREVRPSKVMNKDVVQEIDALSLDEVRGVLFALSNRGGDFFEPSSTQAIRFALSRRGREASPVEALKELHDIGDAQRLSSGRWLPSTTASIEVGSLFVLLSGMPTGMLERAIAVPVCGHGSNRLVSSLPSRGIAGSHTFTWWSGCPESTLEWTKRILATARYPMGATSNLEYFNHWEPFVSQRWTPSLPRSVPKIGPVVARSKGPLGTLYYLCRVEKSQAVAVQELSQDWNEAFRLGFGLRSLANNAAAFHVRSLSADEFEIVVPKFLPSAERMVLRALGPLKELDATFQMTCKLPIGAMGKVEEMLQALGLSKGVGKA